MARNKSYVDSVLSLGRHALSNTMWLARYGDDTTERRDRYIPQSPRSLENGRLSAWAAKGHLWPGHWSNFREGAEAASCRSPLGDLHLAQHHGLVVLLVLRTVQQAHTFLSGKAAYAIQFFTLFLQFLHIALLELGILRRFMSEPFSELR